MRLRITHNNSPAPLPEYFDSALQSAVRLAGVGDLTSEPVARRVAYYAELDAAVDALTATGNCTIECEFKRSPRRDVRGREFDVFAADWAPDFSFEQIT